MRNRAWQSFIVFIQYIALIIRTGGNKKWAGLCARIKRNGGLGRGEAHCNKSFADLSRAGGISFFSSRSHAGRWVWEILLGRAMGAVCDPSLSLFDAKWGPDTCILCWQVLHDMWYESCYHDLALILPIGASRNPDASMNGNLCIVTCFRNGP